MTDGRRLLGPPCAGVFIVPVPALSPRLSVWLTLRHSDVVTTASWKQGSTFYVLRKLFVSFFSAECARAKNNKSQSIFHKVTISGSVL